MMDIKAWRRKASFSEIGGRRIAWWRSGEDDGKPWLLLIHGYPTSSWDWSGLWPLLAEKFNLAALDMLGFGMSEKPKDIVYSIMHQADLQEGLLEQFGVSEAHLFCHDYGDTVGQELLARHNEGTLSFSIRSACFLNGGLFPEQHRARLIQKLGISPLGPLMQFMMNRQSFARSLNGVFGPDTQCPDEELDVHWALINEHKGVAVLHKLLQYIPERRANRERWVGALKEARAPLRLIDGGADPVSGRHLYDYYKAQIPNADAVLFETIGHYPQTEAPEETLAAFLDFHDRLGTFA